MAHGLGNVPAVQEPGRLRKVGFAQPLQTFIAIAQKDVVSGANVAVPLELELAAELSQWGAEAFATL